MSKKRGRCKICKDPGPPKRKQDFLCGDCADPNEIRSFCSGCKSRKKHNRFVALGGVMAGLVLELGIAMLVDKCTSCTPGRFQVTAKIFKIKSEIPAGSLN